MTGDPSRAEALIDLATIANNFARVAQVGVPVMGVVKADAYGHGARQIAQTLRECGAEWLGVALPSEALALRSDGDRGRILAWLWSPGDPSIVGCVEAGVDLSVSSLPSLKDIVAAAQRAGRRARVHIKVDTGLSRNGVPRDDLLDVVDAVVDAQKQGLVEPVGLWSHLASADDPSDGATDRQLSAFIEARAAAQDAGLTTEIAHLSNSAAALNRPDLAFDMVRSGIALYGVTPGLHLGSAESLGLRPAMTLRARLANVKTISAGDRVSYGGTWVADATTRVGLVPVGYADGIPRTASNLGQVSVGGRRCPVRGVIAMDQFVIDLGAGASEQVGDEVVVFGTGDETVPDASDWAQWSGTIGYEIVTRISGRVPRTYLSAN